MKVLLDTLLYPVGCTPPREDTEHGLGAPAHNARGEGCPFRTEGCSPAYLCTGCCEALIAESDREPWWCDPFCVSATFDGPGLTLTCPRCGRTWA